MRWEERVWQDVRIWGVMNWRSVASNRDEWREILRIQLVCLHLCWALHDTVNGHTIERQMVEPTDELKGT